MPISLQKDETGRGRKSRKRSIGSDNAANLLHEGGDVIATNNNKIQDT